MRYKFTFVAPESGIWTWGSAPLITLALGSLIVGAWQLSAIFAILALALSLGGSLTAVGTTTPPKWWTSVCDWALWMCVFMVPVDLAFGVAAHNIGNPQYTPAYSVGRVLLLSLLWVGGSYWLLRAQKRNPGVKKAYTAICILVAQPLMFAIGAIGAFN